MELGGLWALALNGGIGGAAYLVSRFGFRQPPGAPGILGAAVLGWAWITIGMEVLGTAGKLGRWPLLGWVGLGLAVGALCWIARGKPEAAPRTDSPERADGPAALSLGLVLWAAAVLAGPSLLRAVKVVSDGPIYHLYFAARWWKAGALPLIATPFGENAATYFPANGDLWFTWLMVGWGGDAFAKVGQAPFLWLAGFAVVATSRRLGAGRSAAIVASCWFASSSPLLLFSFEPNVDTIFVAGYLLSAYFFVQATEEGPSMASSVLAGLAAGLALGTKAPAIVFVPPLVALGMWAVMAREPSLGRKFGHGSAIVGAMLVTSAYWHVRNAWLTGNPLYPLQLEPFGVVWLRGWYGPEIMKLSPYYLPVGFWRGFVDITLGVFDPRLIPLWLAGLVGLWAVGGQRGRWRDRWVLGLGLLAVANVGLYWLAIPYRTQQRFFLQALGLAAIPLARLLDRSAWLRWAAAALLAAHLLTPQAWPFSAGEPPWDLTPLVPNATPGLIALSTSSWLVLGLTIAIGIASLATAWGWLKGQGRSGLAWSLASTGLLAILAAGAGYPWGADARLRFYPVFPEYIRGWLAFDQRCGPTGARVAYSGTDLPYYLMGVGLRNEVRYVNVDAHPGWLLHDYHRAALQDGRGPARWNHPRPGWDRTHPDYGAWLANLRADRIQLLVVTRANPDEGPHNVADREGFPVERVWADAHPEIFEPLHGAAEGDPQFRLYRVRPPSPDGNFGF